MVTGELLLGPCAAHVLSLMRSEISILEQRREQRTSGSAEKCVQWQVAP